jgi:hypothetical protein
VLPFGTMPPSAPLYEDTAGEVIGRIRLYPPAPARAAKGERRVGARGVATNQAATRTRRMVLARKRGADASSRARSSGADARKRPTCPGTASLPPPPGPPRRPGTLQRRRRVSNSTCAAWPVRCQGRKSLNTEAAKPSASRGSAKAYVEDETGRVKRGVPQRETPRCKVGAVAQLLPG